MATQTYTGAGLNRYVRYLEEARVEGKGVGPEYHLYNHHARHWAQRQRNLASLVKARAAKGRKREVRNLKERLAQVTQPNTTTKVATLKERYEAQQREKIAQGYKVQDATDEVKSVGNGL